MMEFLLKYKYTDNWQREIRETYYLDWTRYLQPYWRGENYEMLHDEPFHIPFLRQQIKKDFGVDFPMDTHRKALLRLG